MNGLSYHSFKNNGVLGLVMVRVGIKVYFGVSLFLKTWWVRVLLGWMGDENIEDFILNFYSKLYMGGMLLRWLRKEINEGIINGSYSFY